MKIESDVWVVILEDRHIDVDVIVCDNEPLAIQIAQKLLMDYSNGRSVQCEYNASMIADGWCFYATYGTEGDSIRVVRRPLMKNKEELDNE